ncbi:10583_t:CDS:2, partial [Scutellospora calospora]
MSLKDIRVVVGGFSYANKVNSEIITHDIWPNHVGQTKTNTALSYDIELNEVIDWGRSALAEKPKKRRKASQYPSNQSIQVELFKLHLGDIPNDEKPFLPNNLNYKRAIIDYLKELGIYNAELIETPDSQNLQFTTEPEAAAIYCINTMKECYSFPVGRSFLLVDCGGGTIDLTTRKLLKGNKLGEITERTGEFCGSAYVDKEFENFIKRIVGSSALKLLKDNHYSQFQFMIQEFCRLVKTVFTGNPEKFKTFELDFQEVCPAIQDYVKGTTRNQLEENDWIVDLDFYTVKAMFDPVISRIITLISLQLSNVHDCTAIFLVGGFSESKYLQNRIKSTFNYIPNILVPKEPVTAIARGAVQYGLHMETIKTRVLKYSYGVKVAFEWQPGDPPNRRTKLGRIFKFHQLANRGTIVKVDEEFSETFAPFTGKERTRSYKIYFTRKNVGKYCDEEGMKFLGELRIDSQDTSLGIDRPVLFSLRFGKMEIDATAVDKSSGQ